MDLKEIMLSQKTSLYRLQTECFYSDNVFDMTNYRDREQISGCQPLGEGRMEEGGCGCKK